MKWYWEEIIGTFFLLLPIMSITITLISITILPFALAEIEVPKFIDIIIITHVFTAYLITNALLNKIK